VADVDASFCSSRYIAQLWIRPGLGRVSASSRILRAAVNAAASLGVRCTAPRRGRWENSAAQNKTAARMVMRNAADPRLSTPLKGSPRISESPFTWLSLTGISAPPRDPNNNNGEDEEDEDEDEEDDKREPAVIREPDEDE
jgi:hypothetical protein